MSAPKLHADADALTLRLGGADPVGVDEMAFAALHLLQRGYAPDLIEARLGPGAQAGLDVLRGAGVDPQALPEIEMPGHLFHPDDTTPADRHVTGGLRRRAAAEPEALALLVEDPGDPEGEPIPVPAAELWEITDAVASRLLGDGLKTGEHLAVTAEPSLESIVLCLAAWEAGLSAVLLRRELPDSYLQIVQDRIAPRLWFMPGAQRLTGIAHWIDLEAGGAATGFDAWMDGGDMLAERPAAAPEREAVVLTTSGSTGQPKMLALSQRNLHETARLAHLADPPGPDTRYASVTDLSALAGLRSLAVLPALGQGASVILAPESRNSSLLALAAIGRHRVTVAQAIVGTLRAAAELGPERLRTLSLGSLNALCCGTGVLHRDVRDRAARAIDCEIRDYFGMNETTGAFAWSATGTLGDEGGLACDILLRVVDDAGQPCAPGEIGHLRLFGERLFIGSYTDKGFEPRSPGWFTSGDMGFRRPDGRFVVTGRSHDLIKTREGEFLSPLSVENAALTHADLRDAVVVRLPDRQGVERYALVVEADAAPSALKPGIHDLIEAELGVFALPELIVALPELPRAAHQKPDRARLKEIVWARLPDGDHV